MGLSGGTGVNPDLHSHRCELVLAMKRQLALVGQIVWLLLAGLQGLEHSYLRVAPATLVVESDGQGKQLLFWLSGW